MAPRAPCEHATVLRSDGRSAPPEMGGRPPPVDGLGSVDHVHGGEPLFPLRHRGADGWESVARFGERLARLGDDPPTPGAVLRGIRIIYHGDLHMLRLLPSARGPACAARFAR